MTREARNEGVGVVTQLANSLADCGAWLDCEPASRRTLAGASDTTDALGVGEGDLIPWEFRRDATHAESNRDRFALLNRQSRERFDGHDTMMAS